MRSQKEESLLNEIESSLRLKEESLRLLKMLLLQDNPTANKRNLLLRTPILLWGSS